MTALLILIFGLAYFFGFGLLGKIVLLIGSALAVPVAFCLLETYFEPEKSPTRDPREDA